MVNEKLDRGNFLKLGEASYALYLFHFPVLNLLKDWRDPIIGGSSFGLIYDISRWVLSVVIIHILALGINHYVDIPIRVYLKKKMGLKSNSF